MDGESWGKSFDIFFLDSFETIHPIKVKYYDYYCYFEIQRYSKWERTYEIWCEFHSIQWWSLTFGAPGRSTKRSLKHFLGFLFLWGLNWFSFQCFSLLQRYKCLNFGNKVVRLKAIYNIDDSIILIIIFVWQSLDIFVKMAIIIFFLSFCSKWVRRIGRIG